jgi:mono/diheme cytochrome c family protein
MRLNLRHILAGLALTIVSVLAFQNCSPGFQVDSSFNSFSASSIESDESVALEVAKGRDLFATNCEQCHSSIDQSPKRKITMSRLSAAIDSIGDMSFLKTLSSEERGAIVLALNATTSPSDVIVSTPAIAKNWDALTPQTCATIAPTRDIVILTKAQYANAITDVFGFTADTSALPNDERDFYRPGASSAGIGLKDVTHLEALYKVATAVAKSFDTNFATVTKKVSSCDQTTAACQTEITLKMLRRLFRHTVLATDTDFVAINEKFKSEPDFKTRLGKILTAALLSPQFLYVVEFEKGARSVASTGPHDRALSGFELASRLSFLIWNSVPDEALLDLAANGTLASPAVLKAQLDRMLADTRAERMMKSFTDQWLTLDSLDSIEKSTDTVPGFSTALVQKMKVETEKVTVDIFKAGSDVRNLYLSPKTYVDSSLATHYGISGVSGSTYVAAQRASPALAGGLLSQGSLAAVSSNDFTDPIHRGLFVYERFMCGRIGEPPGISSTVVIEGTKRAQLSGRMANTNCAGCHGKFEPLGYALEVFDPLGRFRATDESGELTGQQVSLEDGSQITEVAQLAKTIAANPLSGFCLMRNLEKYAYAGSFAPTRGLQCQTENALTTAYRNGNSFKDYVAALVLSPGFTRKLESD